MTQSNTATESVIIDSKSLDEKIWSLTVEDQWHRRSETLVLLHQANAQVKASELRVAEMNKRIQELESLAATDPVTGLMNRRGFESFFAQELERTRRHNTPGSVLILFDLDKFKEINDTYGHQAGDACLKRVAEYLKKKIRSVDAAARIGGDEFAVLLSHTTPEKSARCINEIRSALDGLQAVWQQRILHVKASLGVKHVTDTSSYETAYHAADKNLYDNKNLRKLASETSVQKSANEQLVDDKGNYKIKNLGKIMVSVNSEAGEADLAQFL